MPQWAFIDEAPTVQPLTVTCSCAMAAPRKSQALHELHGTKPHDRTVDHSHVPAGRPKFPKDLDPSLKPIFKRLCRLLQQRRVLTSGDVELMRLYCFVYDRHTRNVKLLRHEGELCTYTRLDSNGQPHEQVKKNIRHDIVTTAERQMAGILNQLGLTPTAKDRAKPTAAEQKPEAQLSMHERYLADIEKKVRVAQFTPLTPPTTLDLG